jgi:Protein of unknown function (DUF1688)
MAQPDPSAAALARTLLTAPAVRERAHDLLALGEADRLLHWRVEPGKMPAVADYVIETMKENYANLDIPLHARWRHFMAGGQDRWGELDAHAPWPNNAGRARAAFDLAIVSVLLDAGAGPQWRYVAKNGAVLSRSEGLAVASFEMFASGAFSADPRDPRRADASRLSAIEASDIARGFQADPDNPLVGLEGRAALLRALGRQVATAPAIFALHDRPRLGGLFDYLVETTSENGTIHAPFILEAVLAHLGAIWPSRLSLGGVPLGDCWRHPLLHRGDATTGLVPFHKLSQWLSYSLIEPLQAVGLKVADIDGLTGLPEYRNGGLFMDLGAIALKEPQEASEVHEPGSTLVVEWRALTVALLDRLAHIIRKKLGLDAHSLPLAKVLEGGSWGAGRRIALKRRVNGAPPLTIVSDGTVF